MTKQLLFIPLFILLSTTPSLSQARRTQPDVLRKGNQLMGQNKVDEAIAEYDRVIKADPHNAEAYFRRGIAQRAKGHLNNAISDYEQALALKPQLAKQGATISEPYFERGTRHSDDLNITAALADMDRAIALYADNPTYFYHRGQARLIAGRYAEAEDDFTRFITKPSARTKSPKSFLDAYGLAFRGYARLKQGKEAAAKEDFEQAEKLAEEFKVQIQLQLLMIEAKSQEWQRIEAERRRRTV